MNSINKLKEYMDKIKEIQILKDLIRDIKKPKVYEAYENQIEGDHLGYFWNEYDAFIEIMKKHRKDLYYAKEHYYENKEKNNYPEKYKKLDKRIILMYMRKLGRMRIKEIKIK